jgi:hypothetical protein
VRQRTYWDWRLKHYPLVVVPMIVYFNAAPQVSESAHRDGTADTSRASGDPAAAAPIIFTDRDDSPWMCQEKKPEEPGLVRAACFRLTKEHL